MSESLSLATRLVNEARKTDDFTRTILHHYARTCQTDEERRALVAALAHEITVLDTIAALRRDMPKGGL